MRMAQDMITVGRHMPTEPSRKVSAGLEPSPVARTPYVSGTSGDNPRAFLYEAVMTALLMFVIMAAATDTRAVGAGAEIAIGGVIGLDALFGGAVTGASMNTARSFG